MTIQIFFPAFYSIILPLNVNWCYIRFICGIAKIIRSGAILNWWIGKITIWFNSFGSRMVCSCGFNSNILKWIFIKIGIKFVPSKLIELSSNVFDYWNWVLFLNVESFCSNQVVIPLMTEVNEPFSGVDGAFKLSVETLIYIRDLLTWRNWTCGIWCCTII